MPDSQPKKQRKSKRSRGRPTEQIIEPIPDTPENVLDALLSSPPKKAGEWKFEKTAGR